MLKNVQQQSKRHSQLRHLIVMLLRILAIAAMVIAFAGPHIPSDNNRPSSNISFVNVFLDNSFSMEARGAEGSLFEQGRLIARDIAMSYKPSDRFRLLSNNPFSFSRAYVSRQLFINELDKIMIDKSSMDFSEIPDKISEDNDNKFKDLYLISDFQKKQTSVNAWKNDSLLKINLIPLIAAKQGNLFVDSVWMEVPSLQLGQTAEIFFELRNHSDKVMEDLAVSLYLGGRKKSILAVSIGAFQSAKSSFIIKLDSVGFYDARINIEDYPVVYDDDFFFSFEVQKSYDVLCIQSDKSNKDLQTYLLLDSSINLTLMQQQEIDYSAFSKNTTLILSSLTDYSSGLLSEVKQFVAKGNNLVILPASDNTIEQINDVYQYLNLPLVETIDSAKRRMQKIDLQSAEFSDIFELVNGKRGLKSNTDLPYFRRIFAGKKTLSPNISVLISNESGQALVLRSKHKAGTIYSFYGSIEAQNSNFSSHAVFVPILYNLINTGRKSEQLSVFLGSTLDVVADVIYIKSGDKILMRHYSDSIEFIPQYRNILSNLILNFEQNPNTVGTYSLMINEEQHDVFSFNYNRNESYLDYYTIKDLEGLLSDKSLDNVDVMNIITSNVSSQIDESTEGLKLWKLFISLAIMFLIFEVFLLRFSK